VPGDENSQNAGPHIEGRQVEKRFGDFTAVRGIDFRVEPGEAFGFLGPNGAGKTSTMRMIACVSQPSGGELRVLGMEDMAHLQPFPGAANILWVHSPAKRR